MSHSTAKSPDLHGIWTAIATPFRTDMQIDWDAFERLLAGQEEAGITGIVIAGTTGESPTLSVTEKLSLIRKARAFLKPSTRIMAGSGDNNTQQSIELSKLARDAGADSLLVVTPPYNKPSTQGLIRHYSQIVTAVDVPVCLYHVPSRTGQFLTVDQIASICQESGVNAVKEASADLGYFSRALVASKVPFLSGDDSTFLASLAVGGAGVISVAANVFPRHLVMMSESFWSCNHAKARSIHQLLLPVFDALVCEVNPGPLKAALASRGICQNVLRLPLAEVSQANYRRIADAIGSVQAQLDGIQ